MKKHEIIIHTLCAGALIFALVLLSTPNQTSASMLLLPFGGQVTSARSPANVTCPGLGPILNRSVAGIPTPFYVAKPKKPLKIGSWFMGMYNTIMTPTCQMQTPYGPTPYMVYPVLIYGSSDY